MRKTERLNLLFKRLNNITGGSCIAETRRIILAELNIIENKYATLKNRMDIVELTDSKYVHNYGQNSILIRLLDHKLIINRSGAFLITCITGNKEYARRPNAQNIDFEE